jgi:uncharacterized coiled-coil DUF342 family protein
MISDKLKFIDSEYKKLETRIADYTKKIAQLTAAGTSQAKWYVRKDNSKKTGEIIETFYLLHPMRNGKRKKEYVGRDEYQIKLAQDRIDRYELRGNYIETLAKLQNRRDDINELVNKLVKISGTENLLSMVIK